jgi:protein phosphatase
VTRQQVQLTINASDRPSADQIIDRLEQAATANQPPPAISPAPSDAGGASDAGGLEEDAAEDMEPLPSRSDRTIPPPDEGEET